MYQANQKLNEFGEIIYMSNISKIELKKFLQDNIISYMFANPKKKGFILDSEVLIFGSVKVFNKSSTGLNHIDNCYSKKNRDWLQAFYLLFFKRYSEGYYNINFPTQKVRKLLVFAPIFMTILSPVVMMKNIIKIKHRKIKYMD